jgi:hypothetical protein
MATEVASPTSLMSSGSGSAPPTPTIATPSSSIYSQHTPSSGGASSSNSKRPPRKSTLTQQQKLQKRQRATQDQLTTLEMEFNKNPTPAAEVRLQIAEEINMTERSVQIWFQNRRAKIKLMAKKSLETGEDIDSIPESMRAYLAMQAMESGKGIGTAFLGRTGLGPYNAGGMQWGVDGGSHGKVVITHLHCQSLSIGRWTRVSQATMDLLIFYSAEKSTMTYYIHNDQAGYKIEYPFSYIKNIQLDNGDSDPNRRGGIIIELTAPPFFFMDSSPNTNGFCQTGDFTEDEQASRCLVHRLGGNPKHLSGELAKLVSLEAFQQRHAPPPPMFDPRPLPMSAPVSPTNRPSSQPSFNGPPHIGMFQESWGISQPHPGMRGGPGHKRQRSRSVPAPVDFSMFQSQMPSFYIQQPSDVATSHVGSPNLYAPVPQQPSSLGPNLRIDTQAGLGLDMRQYPMSATTAPHSPADFPSSPGYFSQAPEHTPLPASGFATPYGSTFLSPMVDSAGMIPPSVSPLSFTNHTEPSIVEQSPPMSIMGRPGSEDLYSMDNACAVSDDGTGLNEMYSKHTINIPIHPPHSPGYPESTHGGELDMSQLVSFDPVDPSSLSPHPPSMSPEVMPQMVPQ